MKECENCITLVRSQKKSLGKIRAHLSFQHNAKINFSNICNIRGKNSTFAIIPRQNFIINSDLKPKENIIFGPKEFEQYNNGFINAFLAVSGNIQSRVGSSARFTNYFTDKISGPISDMGRLISHINKNNFVNFSQNFGSTEITPVEDTQQERLYPVKDITVCYDNNCFVNESGNSNNLYSSIDEGILNRTYNNSNYIQPSSINTFGTYRYTFAVSSPMIKPDESYLLFRAIAPTETYASKLPPVYTFYNIRFEDPSGNLIIKYKDIVARGDADFKKKLRNYTTYATEPEINNALLYTWDKDYPILGSGRTEIYIDPLASGYTLNFDLDIECLDDPFDTGFNFGYEEKDCNFKFVENDPDNYLALRGSPLSTQSEWYRLNVQDSIRITALEMSNEGPLSTLTSNHLSFYTDVSPTGIRLSRTLLPIEVLPYDYDTDIYPTIDSVWKSSLTYNQFVLDNISGDLSLFVRDLSTDNYISLNSPQDSGKLKLKFTNQAFEVVNELIGGPFNIGFLNPNPAFQTAKIQPIVQQDIFFTIDTIELRVVAKKAPGSRNYSLDVVGYSDDKLLNVTSRKGGFLQNIEGSTIGEIPLSSGLNPIDELAIAAESLSEKEQYFESNQTNNAGGDHYLLTTDPVIDSTEFKEYTIPLQIYEDKVPLGKSIDYSMSSYFENLYLDIYPIPSGASISSARLIVSYKPSNGLNLHTVAQGSRELINRDVVLLPSSSIGNNIISSSGNQFSKIENIPHGFSTISGVNDEFTLKTNYSRRWRGVAGDKVVSAFSDIEFDYSFEKEFVKFPFTNYYDFNSVDGNLVIPFNITPKIINTPLTCSDGPHVINNIGSRFKTSSLFNSQTPYQTIDWTSIEGYENHELYGKLSDSYDSCIRLGSSSLTNSVLSPLESGFAIFIRFSPDINISGTNYNLFNSGVLFSINNSSDFACELMYNNGHLAAYAKNNIDEVISVQDSLSYVDYTYPLSVIVTYNEEEQTLKLYTENENVEHNILRGESDSFAIKSLVDPSTHFATGLINPGMNMFVTDIGISYFEQTANSIGKLTESSIYEFFDSIRIPQNNDSKYKLWKRVDNNTDLWHLGAFTICEFNHEFDRFTKRIGSDYIFHYLKHNGSGYSDTCNIVLPNSIPSGLSYHTQIENDMLRFSLGNESGTFKDVLFSPLPRINKNLPRGYNFSERAFVVDTIIEYDTYNDIIWENNQIGPRFIVSLYTKNKEPLSYPTKNYGLINRHIHYLEPSGCWRKISSTFDAKNFFDDTTEPWSNFNANQKLNEFNHKYFSKDIEDMFLQYDLVYPSGPSFESTLKIHAINVKLKDALVTSRDLDNDINLHVSGEQVWREILNLNMPNVYDVTSSGMNLYASGNKEEASGFFNLYASASARFAQNSMFLYSARIGTIDNIGSNFFGSFNPVYGLTMYVSGQKFDDSALPLYLENKLQDQSSSGIISLYVENRLSKYSIDNQVNFYTKSIEDLINFFPSERMNLFIQSESFLENISSYTNLYIDAFDPSLREMSESLSLFTINYSAPPKTNESQKESFTWNSKDFGTGIELDDELAGYPFLNADDEIRGVDITCYGDCPNGTCKELEIITHETVWGDAKCVDGGIFRASNVYTNLETSGFKTDIGYSGHFYGIRKYVGLIPDAPYRILMTGKTASSDVINVPREMDTIEYGTNEQVAYSGIKLISNERQEGDLYGKSTVVKGDLMAISAPYHTVYDDQNYPLHKAGAIFIYRRDMQPTGFSWEYDKANWNLETKLTLPSEYLRDYSRNKVIVPLVGKNNNKLGDVIETVWRVGQEGRELGYSLDATVTKNREIIVAGGPGAKWSRTFDDAVEPSGVNIGVFILSDGFIPTFFEGTRRRTYEDVLDFIKDKDLLFRYYASPFPIKFNVKIIICDCNNDPTYISPDFPAPSPPSDFIYKKVIARNEGGILETEKIVSGIKDIFNEVFPYDETKLNNNIPVILGFNIDTSFSFGTEAIQPGLNSFIDYYKDYSFSNGLRDSFGMRESGATTIFQGDGENWIKESIEIIDHVLDTGRLQANNQVRFLTQSLVEPNFNTAEFNDPPPSGGAVYVFEKEDDDWSLTQIIESPNTSNIIHPDRFGHAVKISDNGEVIVVGSPYIDEAFSVYQYNPNEKEFMFRNLENWVLYQRENDKTFGYYWSLKDRLDQLKLEYQNTNLAVRKLYAELTPSAKYNLRSNYDFWIKTRPSKIGIQEYEKIFTYNYGSISYIGTFDWLIKEFAPTSRLGYSVATNEDGSIVALGAPTDSFNEYDDRNVYYFQNSETSLVQSKSKWASYVNAGAVRLFESRKYYPHNLVVDYGKFGNLRFENREEGEDPFFNHMENIFKEIGRPFIKTDFDEVNIPNEAGLVFINAPAINALSQEILDNIRNWLSLGDRHLVLIGDDPYYESDGLYAESNNIINKILNGLNSRMRIYPARNASEALLTNSYDISRPNIIPSTKPTYPRGKEKISYGIPGRLYASGVGDIRLYYPNASMSYSCTLSNSKDPFIVNPDINVDLSFQKLNGKCKIPLVHYKRDGELNLQAGGDLRAEWFEECYDIKGRPIKYAKNWAYFFGTVREEDYGCHPPIERPRSSTVDYEPIPLLSAAEYLDPVTITYPGYPPSSSVVYDTVQESIPAGTREYATFGSPLNDEIQFAWSSGTNIFNSLSYSIGSVTGFFDPPEYNQKDPILQAYSTTKENLETVTENVDDGCPFATIESVDSCDVVLISSLSLETEQALNEDIFIPDLITGFYTNIILNNKPSLKIGQLGEWTGRNNFATAKENNDSNLMEALSSRHFVIENITSSELKTGSVRQGINIPQQFVGVGYDVCWIANPKGLPNAQQLEDIKRWMNYKPNINGVKKRLIITYEKSSGSVDNDINTTFDTSSYETVRNVVELCSLLNISMKPRFLSLNKNRFALDRTDAGYASSLIIHPNFATNKIVQIPLTYQDKQFVPIDRGQGSLIAFNPSPVKDEKFNRFTTWQLKPGVAKVEFPVLPGSGYKVFIDIVSESPNEKIPLIIDVSKCSDEPQLIAVSPGPEKQIFEFNDQDRKLIAATDNIGYTIDALYPNFYNGRVNTISFDIQAASNTNSISVYISSPNQSSLRVDNNDILPRTPRLIAVSGCLLNVNKQIVALNTTIQKRIPRWVNIPGAPPLTVTYNPPPREISTDNTKYCPLSGDDGCSDVLGNQLIEDGPIVVAQEIEQFSTFEVGEKRSRITVISDSSMIQGKLIANDQGVIHRSVINLLQSFYPPNPTSTVSGRQFNISHKIISPERLSPHKLFSATSNPGNNMRFGNIPSSVTNLLTFNEYIYDPSSDSILGSPRPYEVEQALEYDFTILLPEELKKKRTKEQLESIRDGVRDQFRSTQNYFGGTSKFSSVINAVNYTDASCAGGMPSILTNLGYDYLDFDKLPSGYPGDLFGYSIALYGKKLIVGSPFAAFSSESLTNWNEVAENTPAFNKPSGAIVGFNGGAGAVYVFERTGNGITPQGNATPWECTRKIRPNSINVGQDLNDQELASSGFYLGDHSYLADDLLHNSIVTDQFGYDVDIDGDILVVGAPGHDFGNYIEESIGEFMNKAFGFGLDIPTRKVWNIGESGIRNELFLGGSGVNSVLNNGAVFVFENRIYDWINKIQRWEFVEKIVPQGYKSRLQQNYDGYPPVSTSGSENDYFGKSVSVDRTKRTDADYTIVIGSPHHKFATNDEDEVFLNAGATYSFDAMLREKAASKADPNAFIQAKLFGGGDQFIRLGFSNNNDYNKRYETTGIIYSNNQGEIFLEVSGQDPLLKGFITHRPFIEFVQGAYVFGLPQEDYMRLYIDGQPLSTASNMNLFSESKYGIVYNTLGLYEEGVTGSDSGNLVLYTDCPAEIEIIESGFTLYASGTGLDTEILNLRIRGK